MYGGSEENIIIKDILQLAEKAHGYVRILCNEMHIVIFRQCHTHWKDLLKDIIHEEIDKHKNTNKMELLGVIKKDIMRKNIKVMRND